MLKVIRQYVDYLLLFFKQALHPFSFIQNNFPIS